ncbi:peptidase inhibitor I42 [Pseudoxanthomonas kalamensis DSM 18571]|uniref:protease inhibitor I42 family protein n=1 Tax=Pseudoxanthomonas kalamensis TaxID=289483 RepID=UPI0013920DE4|nr:protease inhibitor I42 family protein [Pseudoxanthomonas kalamensis]KAF1712358.1 peptidase inhibitor I42 [Pseudoxanthomonas kalamensis DSM 18571]
MTVFRTSLLTVALLAACASPRGRPVQAGQDAPTELRPGQEMEIALQGNASTGYQWELVADGAPQLSVLPSPATKESPEAKTGRVGTSSTYYWHFRAERPGETTVRLVYRRAWEGDQPPADEASYAVIVRADE